MEYAASATRAFGLKVPADYVGIKAVYGIKHRGDVAGAHEVVGVEEEGPRRVDGVEAALPCRGRSRAGFREQTRGYVGVALSPLADDGGRAVGRGIVDDYQLKAARGLSRQGGKHIRKERRAVEHRHHHRQ